MSRNFQGSSNPLFRPSILQMGAQQQPTIHNMPQPSSIPWAIENMPWAQQSAQLHGNPKLMEFGAEYSNCVKRRAQLHAKRKSDIVPVPTPAKQFISEEKISAHFNSLHISNNAAQNANTLSMEDALMDAAASPNEYRVTAKELEEKLKNANKITVCEDVLKMQKEQNKVSLLPAALINRIEKPCTALVLWQPPPILELLHRKDAEELQKAKNIYKNSNQKTLPEDLIDDIEFFDADNIDDFIDNNNTCNIDYNDGALMDEDL